MTVAGMTGFIGIGEQEGGSVEVMKKAGGREELAWFLTAMV